MDFYQFCISNWYALPVNQLSAKKQLNRSLWTPPKQMIFRYTNINHMCGILVQYAKQKHPGVKKVRGQEGAAL